MSLFDRASQLRTLLFEAIENVVNLLNAKYNNQEVYALVFYPSSGYRDIGVAYATNSDVEVRSADRKTELDTELLEMLKNHPDLMNKALAQTPPQAYLEVNACEWAGASSYTDLFSGINGIIHSEYDALYEAGVDNREICQFFEGLLSDVLQKARSSEMLNGPAFADDVLLGIQFPDSSNSEVVRKISKSVNSAKWHERLATGYGDG